MVRLMLRDRCPVYLSVPVTLVYCGQTVFMRPHCIRWEPASPRKGAQQPPPLFGPCLLWLNGRPSQQLLHELLSEFFHREILK